MAARFDASTDVLSRSASGLGSTAVTMCCWMLMDVDRNDWTSFMGADDASANWFLLTLDGSGAPTGDVFSASTTGGFATGAAVSAGTWYFVAMVYDPSGTDTLYWAAAGASLSSAASSPNPMTGANDAWTFRVGNNGFSEWLNGRVACGRVWTAALNSTEIAAERAAMNSAARTANLWADWPLGTDANDISGNARHLTAAGSVTWVAGPPVALTVANSAQAQASESPTLATGTSLAVANSAQAQSSTSPALTQHQVLVVANSAQAQASTNVTLVRLRYPTTVDASGRFLLDQFGDPWLGIGDTVWSVVGSLNDAQIAQLIDGLPPLVNLLLLSSPEPYYAPNAVPSDPRNVDNVAAWAGGVFGVLNDVYWDRFDLLLDLAEATGRTVLCCPFYLGFSDTDGFGAQVDAAGNTAMADYAVALHARYGDRPNLMWLIGHDRIPSGTLVTRADAFLTALQAAGNTQLWMFGGWHPDDVGGTDTVGYGSESWTASSHTAPVDNVYDYSKWIAHNAYGGWDLSPARPVGFLEGIYELEQGIGEGDVLLREQLYAAFCAGLCFVVFGNNPRWNFGNKWIYDPGAETWETSLTMEGTEHLAAFATITATLTGWQGMAADTGSTFCTTQGTGTNRVAARFGPDGGLVYHPAFTAGSITLDLTEFDDAWSTVTVTRIDPVSGAVTVVDASEATTNSAFGISAPAANSVGDNDWLFVVSGLTAKLTVADSGQGQASTSPTLTQHHVLTVADSGQAQTSTAPTLTQHQVLTAQDSAQAQVSEAPALTQHHVLAVSSSAQAQASEQPTLVQHQVLTVDSSSQAQTSDSPSLVQHHVLTVDSSAQTQASENVTLHTEEQLSVQSSFQAQTSGEPSLVQHHVLVVQSSAQAQASQSPTLDAETITLVPASTGQDQASESPSLVQHQVLAVQSSAQAQTSTSPTLVQHQVLVVASSNQTQASTTVNLSADDTVFVGGTVVVDVRLGTQTVTAIYVGTDQVWP